VRTEGFSLGLRQPGHEANHSPPSNTEAKITWNYISTPLHIFLTWRLIKHMDNFTVIFHDITKIDYEEIAKESVE
jgi:hypothetical protein